MHNIKYIFYVIILCTIQSYISLYIFEYSVDIFTYNFEYYPTFITYLICEILSFSGLIIVLYLKYPAYRFFTLFTYPIFISLITYNQNIPSYLNDTFFVILLFRYTFYSMTIFYFIYKYKYQKKFSFINKFMLSIFFCLSILGLLWNSQFKYKKFTASDWKQEKVDDSSCYRGKYVKHLVTILYNNNLNYSHQQIKDLLGTTELTEHQNNLTYNLGYCSLADYVSLDFKFQDNKLKKISIRKS